ncbi:fimbrial protein [Vibrio diabolicus]|uniref:fimbrial protein n=1 Tax=Vibrio diabolicus TaxID=50719 RepID=UPI00211B35D7|nr:hypothetical protein [Vibrio diabolicus]MCG6283767.1 hypothetical protein [Vibrio diabolicus]MCR9307227.1 hypothetical protein [Vibrio diabolicus]
MKKVSLATIILASLLSSASVFANTGTVQFYGSISDVTCNFTAEQNGAQTNNIDLGTWTVTEVTSDSTDIIDFALVGKSDTGEACDVSGKTQVDISWIPSSGAWDAYGLQNTGTAQNAAVKLMDVNDAVFNTVNSDVTYDLSSYTDGRLPFKAQIVKTSDSVSPGTVLSSASFAVAYK